MRRLLAILFLLTLFCTLLPHTQAVEQKLAAFTFDDGPHPTITPALLDALAERGVSATFFVNGRNAERYPELVLRAAAEGHQIANHTYAHKQLTLLTDEEVCAEVSRTQDYLSELLGEADYLVRVPYGAISQRVQDLISVPIMMWSVDPTSGKVMSGAKMRDGILRTVHDGAIILLHDTSQANLTAAIESIDAMLADGYRFVTLDELFAYKGKTAEGGEIYHKVGGETIGAFFDESRLDTHWAYEDICYVKEAGIMEGDARGFRPDWGMTRAEGVTVLYRLAGSPETAPAAGFRDVKAEDWYAAAVAWAVEQGITAGISTDTFGAAGYVTKEQFYTFFARYLAAQELCFTEAELAEQEEAEQEEEAPQEGDAELCIMPGDADAADWAQEAIRSLRSYGFITKEEVPRFAPKSGMTRAQVAELITWYEKLFVIHEQLFLSSASAHSVFSASTTCITSSCSTSSARLS